MKCILFKYLKNKKGDISIFEAIGGILIILLVSFIFFDTTKAMTGYINTQQELINRATLNIYDENNETEKELKINQETETEIDKKIETETDKETNIQTKTNLNKSEENLKHNFFYDLNINIIGQFIGSILIALIGFLFAKSKHRNKIEK